MFRGVVDQVIDDLFDGGSLEADERLYSWIIQHMPANKWVPKQTVDWISLTSVAASNRHAQIRTDWAKKLGLSGGWLYIGRFYWNGTNAVRDRCEFMYLPTLETRPC